MATSRDGEEISEWEKSSANFETKQHSEYFDPCADAAARSMRCLHRNGGDRELCADYFQAYRDCKKKWVTERSEAKRKNARSWFS